MVGTISAGTANPVKLVGWGGGLHERANFGFNRAFVDFVDRSGLGQLPIRFAELLHFGDLTPRFDKHGKFSRISKSWQIFH